MSRPHVCHAVGALVARAISSSWRARRSRGCGRACTAARSTATARSSVSTVTTGRATTSASSTGSCSPAPIASITRQFRETDQPVRPVRGRRVAIDGLRRKFALARPIAAVLGTLVLDQGDAAGLLAVGDGVHYLAGAKRPSPPECFLWEFASLDLGNVPLSPALARALGLLKRRGLVIVVSDFYDADALGTIAPSCASRPRSRRGRSTLSDDELDASTASGAAEFVDAETGRAVVVQAEAAAAAYASRVKCVAAGPPDRGAARGIRLPSRYHRR